MVAFIYIKYESKCSLKVHQSLSQIYQNRPIATFLPPTAPYCFRIDLNNVSSDTPFPGQSSETELHKPFTTRSLWLMAGPLAKAPGPGSPLKNITAWFLIVSNENTVVIRKDGGNPSECDSQAQIYNSGIGAISAADFLCLMPMFLFPGVEFRELRLMDWPDAQIIATMLPSVICVCLGLFVLKGRPVIPTVKTTHFKWNARYSHRFLLHDQIRFKVTWLKMKKAVVDGAFFNVLKSQNAICSSIG